MKISIITSEIDRHCSEYESCLEFETKWYLDISDKVPCGFPSKSNRVVRRVIQVEVLCRNSISLRIPDRNRKLISGEIHEAICTKIFTGLLGQIKDCRRSSSKNA